MPIVAMVGRAGRSVVAEHELRLAMNHDRHEAHRDQCARHHGDQCECCEARPHRSAANRGPLSSHTPILCGTGEPESKRLTREVAWK
jgi:hypothetical protein